MERLGPGGGRSESDRRTRPVPAGGAQRAVAGLKTDGAASANQGDTTLAYALKPVPPFRLDLAVWVLRRRREHVIDRWDGRCYRRVLALDGRAVQVAVTQRGPADAPRLQVCVDGDAIGPRIRPMVTAALERLLGLRVDLTEFERFAARDARLSPLAERFRGMKPPRFPTVFESLANAIACQQVSLALGIVLLGRLAAAYGLNAGNGDEEVHAFPEPGALAGRPPEELRPLGFSRQKARALIDLAGAVAEGRLDLEALATESDETVVDRLQQLRGVGRWTAEYVLLRGLGRLHVFPGDDVGARNNLQRWLGVAGPLDYEGVRRTLEPWHAYSGLIYFHLLLNRLAEAGAIATADPTRS